MPSIYEIIDDDQDHDIPQQALEALSAASSRAAQAGFSRVVVQNHSLVRIDASGTTVLRRLPDRPRVESRVKFVKS